MPAGALAGLCPACLLAQGAETDSGDGASGRRFEPPPLAEVAKLFPQLEILDLLGAGGMGAVYKARQPALDRIVALKVLPSQNAHGVNFAERFNREARALARLSHPNIVSVHEFGQAGALSYFIMEFVDGANLRLLEQGSRLSPREALQIIPQICDALQYAHDEGVVHRDIKPENVLVDRKGRVKIADFGLAKILGADTDALRLTAEGQVMGTPHYMAPEQVEKPLAVDHRADIYALGVVFYEMLTGDLPLGKFSPPSRKVQVDVRLDDVVLRALENDPARRYQRASEVKSQVETIASTPEVAPSASRPALQREFIRCIGFPLLVKSGSGHAVHWKGVAQAFAVMFALLTIAFGLVSIFTGSSAWGWLGIVGLPSVVARLALSAVFTAWGVRLAWLAKERPAPSLAPPKTPQATVILPAEGVSRKAVAGACWASLFFVAGLLYFVAHTVVSAPYDATESSQPSIQWWQILLIVTVLPLGITAPFGTTILGWLAVGDIRRSQGRITGLPLAVFDGLFFPLLAVNALLVWMWIACVRAVAESSGESYWGAPWPAISTLGAVVICLIATFDISRRVWRALHPDGAASRDSGGWWWSSKAGGAVLVVLCLVVIGVVASRRSPSDGWSNRPAQIAQADAQRGRLVAKLPGRGTVELLAIGERYGAMNGWWSANGTPLSNSLYEVRGGVDNVMGNRVAKEFLVREVDLPDGASSVSIEAQPASGSGSGGEVFLNGGRVQGARQVRLAWDASVRTANIQIGYGLEPWRTIATHDAAYQSRQHRRLATDPGWTVNFHHSPTETKEGAQIALIFGPEDPLWNHRMVAVDTNGVEHPYSQGNGTPVEKLTLWTYSFHKVPLAAVKEFQLQVRPVHWVEFPDVALVPNAPLPPPEPTASAELWSPKIEPGQSIDPGKIRDEANEMMKLGDYEAALQRHIWIHNHALEVASGQTGVRLSFYLSDWVELGRRYPKARRALIEVRDRKTRELEEGLGYADLFKDVVAINQYLNAEDATSALFKRIHERDPQLAAQCVGSARKALVKSQEYELCLTYIKSIQEDLDRLVKNRADELRRLARDQGPHPAFRKSADTRFANSASLLIQMLRGVGRVDEAEEIQAQAAAILGDAALLTTSLTGDDGTNAKRVATVSEAEPLPTPPPANASLGTWAPTISPGDKLDIPKLLGVASAMVAAQDYESALQRFLWIYNHAKQHGGDPLGGISDWIELGRRYPKARKALVEIRDSKAYDFERGQGYFELFGQIWFINRYLGEEDETTRLFIRVHQIDPSLAQQCFGYARDALVKSREHELFLSYIPDVQGDFERWKQNREMEQGLSKKLSFMDNPGQRRSVDSRFVTGVSQLIEVLAAVGRNEDAERIRVQAAALVDDPQFKSAGAVPASRLSDPGASTTLDELPPVILRTFPVAGARDVEPGDVEVRATFNKAMTDGSWSWSEAWAGSTPSTIGQPRFEDDHRTCVFTVKLEPGRTYAWWLNSDQFRNFKDKSGRASVPYLLMFQTKQN
jgi:hypothetical protein